MKRLNCKFIKNKLQKRKTAKNTLFTIGHGVFHSILYVLLSMSGDCFQSQLRSLINPLPEGYGSRFVIRSFVYSVHCVTESIIHFLRYEQAKHVDGLQCDSWILLKCFHSRVMAAWLTVIAFLESSEDKTTHSWLPRHF